MEALLRVGGDLPEAERAMGLARRPEWLRRFPGWVGALGLVLTALFLLWSYVSIAERLMYPGDGVTRLDRLQSVEGEGLAAMTAHPHGYGVNVFSSGLERGVLTGDLTETMARYDDPAILIPRARRKVRVFLNNDRQVSETTVSQVENYAIFRPQLFRLGPSIVPGARADVRFEMQSRLTSPYMDMPIMGEGEALKRSAFWRTFFGFTLTQMAAAICFVIAFVSAALGLRRGNRVREFSFATVMMCWALINFYYSGIFSALNPVVGGSVMAAANYLLIIASLSFVNLWTFRWRWMQRWLVPILLGIVVFKLMPIILTGGTAFTWVRSILDVIAAITMTVMIGMLVASYALGRTQSASATLIFLIMLFAVTLDIATSVSPAIGYAIWPVTGQTVHAGTPMSIALGMTVIAAVARTYLASQDVLKTANQTLSRELAARELEIRAVYREREEQARQAILLSERKRIMRDMHDGIGGNLLSLSLRAKGGRLTDAELSNELGDNMQQLRLIVDSLDTADGELDIALGTLRGRIEPSLAEAGITLDWRIEELGDDTEYGPREVLSVYRMIQEAVTNAIRHSGASRLWVSAERVDADWLRVRVADDGCGMDGDSVPGKGLENLRQRATGLGGRMQISRPEGGGTSVLFTLPSQPDTDLNN